MVRALLVIASAIAVIAAAVLPVGPGWAAEPAPDPATQQFEIRFMETLIRHHRKAITEAEKCLARGYHDELRDLCQGIIETQSAEIAQLETWLCQWYGRCRGRP